MPLHNATSEPTTPAGRHLPVEVLRRYVAGELGAAEQHQVESHTLDCAQCADILTGLEMQPVATTEASLQELRQRLGARVAELATENEPIAAPFLAWRQLAAAAVLLLTLGAVAWFTLRRSAAPEVASNSQRAVERLAIRAPRPLPTPQHEAESAAVLDAPMPPDVVARVVAPSKPAPMVARRRARSPQYARVAPKAPNGADVAPASAAMSMSEAVAGNVESGLDTTISIAKSNAGEQKQEYAVQAASAAAEKPGAASAMRTSGLPAKRNMKSAGAPSAALALRTVSGRITDQTTGQGVQGATVLVPGTQQGASTAADGSFSLTVPVNTPQLSISSIGYAAKTQPLKPNDSTLALALAPDNKSLSEVVVVRREAAPTPMSVSAMPAGGYGSLKKYLKDSLDYPEKALEAHTEGTVRLRFVVGEDGKVSDIKVIKKVSDECDAEAVRLIQEGPAWFPAISNGRRTARQVEVSVPFKIEGR
ncbi:TonB family C-terminal domain-containing protein [Hymenobacter gelipurpurascens]|uniref:TonB family C-terminal domain-containing protein n=1 Tax=Hymenobacter gelipurpurascens TaxID=89968 RepID=A0A212UEX4_9BACT|nr:TonB family protein [Hymenobacter gelipurpurascens]SNC76799.1 TonB family C-terminal domain-containing protein [Hymenobacter gelipurpurascens]